jgi:microcystin-dependent protein
MSLQFIITDAGRAAIAQVGGAIGPVTLTKIALGSAGYTPLANRTALQTEIKRLDPSGSSVPVPGTISITAQDNSADSYSVKEIGLYTNNNVLFAICAQSAVIMTKASGSVALFAMDFVMTNVPAGTVTVGNVGFTYSQATETSMGVLGIATTAEAQAGAIDTKIITPLKLAQVTATESRRGVIALASSTEAQALVPDATKALTVARLLDRTATTGRAGVVLLASNAETQTGNDAAKAVTPAGLAARTATDTRAGIVELATSAQTQTGVALDRAVTPAGLKSTLGNYSVSTHTHAASAIISGTIDNARLNVGTTTAAGIVQLATVDEAKLGTLTTKAVTPAALKDSLTLYAGSAHTHAASAIISGTIDNARLTKATSSVAGIVELAENAETQTGTATNLAVTPAGLKISLTGYAALAHTHDDRYYTEIEMNNLLAGKQAAGSYAAATHTHDDRYYQKTQTNILLDGKQAVGSYAPATGIAPGAITGTAVITTDSRLSDSRTPNSHAHGNITNVGAIGTTANLPLITGANGVLQAGQFGTAINTFCQGNDSRLSQATSSAAGIVELADNTETQTGTATNLAVTPASLASRTATETRAGIVELATNVETQTGTDTARAVTPASLASAAALFVPPGAVMPFAMNVVPSGWLAANGSAVSRTLYPALFAAIGTLYGVGNGSTTFALPDLRGYFVRGSGTNSDGTAAGTFGAKQADAFQGHIHANSGGGAGGTFVTAVTGGTQSKTNSADSGSNNMVKGPVSGTSASVSWTQPAISGPSTDGTNGTPRTESETRPRNIALLYCIKI